MTKHRVFISYYHKDDEYYRNLFENCFSDILINVSVNPNDVNDDNSTNYIKRIIREDYISSSSVVVVLIGPHTYCRKFVDWEIYAGLHQKAGLVGIMLPTHPDFNDSKIRKNNVPPRLYDNVVSGYSKIYNWDVNEQRMKNIIEEAFNNRKKDDLIKNNKIQYKQNKCE